MCIIDTLYSTCVNLYPGKEAKLFEYAEGLPPDVAEFYSMDDRGFTYENEIPINNSISYLVALFIIFFFYLQHSPVEADMRYERVRLELIIIAG